MENQQKQNPCLSHQNTASWPPGGPPQSFDAFVKGSKVNESLKKMTSTSKRDATMMTRVSQWTQYFDEVAAMVMMIKKNRAKLSKLWRKAMVTMSSKAGALLMKRGLETSAWPKL